MNKRMFRSHRDSISHSNIAEKGANSLLDEIKLGIIVMDTLPNSSSNFTGELEYDDYLSFSTFLPSTNGKVILSRLEEN